MKIEEVKDMLPQKPERLETVAEPKRQELTGACYDLIGCLHEVYKELGSGLPEYIYQEAVAKVLKAKSVLRDFRSKENVSAWTRNASALRRRTLLRTVTVCQSS